MTRKRVHWGQTPFRVNDDPEVKQLDVEYDPELGQSDPITCPADRIPGRFGPGMEFGPNQGRTQRGGGGGAGGSCPPPPPEIFKAKKKYTQILYFQIVLSVNQKIMQLK